MVELCPKCATEMEQYTPDEEDMLHGQGRAFKCPSCKELLGYLV